MSAVIVSAIGVPRSRHFDARNATIREEVHKQRARRVRLRPHTIRAKVATVVEQMNELFAGDLSESDLVTYAQHITGRTWCMGGLHRCGRSKGWGGSRTIRFARNPVLRLEEQSRPAAEVRLTAQELEILRLLDQRVSTAQVAKQLVVTVGTVYRRLSVLQRKVGMKSRSQAPDSVCKQEWILAPSHGFAPVRPA